MSTHGANDKETRQYTPPENAVKGREYVCAQCNQRVIFRKGNVRTPHFAHFVPTTKCAYYNTSPGESDSHKHAKLLLQKWLIARRPIRLVWGCNKHSTFGQCGGNVERNIDYKDGDEVVIEYRGPTGGYVADVAVVNAGKLRYIIEIMHSHRTTTTTRPEPWFEVSADQISEGCHFGEEVVYLDNCRINNPGFCSNCSAKSERWAANIPILAHKYGNERGWRQDTPCICCKRTTYNPEWVAGRPRQVCKICLGGETQKVRDAVTAAIWE